VVGKCLFEGGAHRAARNGHEKAFLCKFIDRNPMPTREAMIGRSNEHDPFGRDVFTPQPWLFERLTKRKVHIQQSRFEAAMQVGRLACTKCDSNCRKVGAIPQKKGGKALRA